MTIAKRITSISGALMALTVAVTAISFYSLSSLSKTLNFIANDPIPGIILLSKMQGIEANIRQGMLRYVASSDKAGKSEMARRIADDQKAFRDTHGDYKKTITQQDDRELSEKMANAFDQTEKGFNKVLSASGQGKGASAYETYVAEVAPWTSKLSEILGAEVQLNARNATEGATSAVRDSGSTQTLMLILLAVSLGLGISISWLIIRSLNATLRNVTVGLNEGANQVASASGQVAGSSQSLAQGSSEQAASLEEISASMEEMTAMTKRNSENSSEAMAMMSETASQVERSNLALDEMVSSMDAIKVSSEKVAKINRTIDEIAFQTNILALNAAVEAARAGEAGMGFAVVADEVRNLAQRSAVAAKDTAALIEEAISNSNLGAGKLEQVASAIRGITDSAGKVKHLIDEVNEASKQQTQGISQVSMAVNQVSKVTQTAAASAEEGAAASEELSAQAQSVQDLVSQLQVLVDGEGVGAGVKERQPQRKAKPASKPRVLPGFGKSQSSAAVADEFPLDDPGPGSFKSF